MQDNTPRALQLQDAIEQITAAMGLSKVDGFAESRPLIGTTAACFAWGDDPRMHFAALF